MVSGCPKPPISSTRRPLPPCLPLAAGCLQVGTPGEEQAAQYLLAEMQRVADLAAERRPDLRAEAARESVRTCMLACLPSSSLLLAVTALGLCKCPATTTTTTTATTPCPLS